MKTFFPASNFSYNPCQVLLLRISSYEDDYLQKTKPRKILRLQQTTKNAPMKLTLRISHTKTDAI